MDSLLFPMVAVVVLLVSAMHESMKVRRLVKKHSGKASRLPKAIHVLVISAQLSELMKMIGQVSLVSVVTSLFLLVILIASRPGTESELH